MEISNAIQMLAVARRIAARNNTTPEAVLAQFESAVNQVKLSASDFLLPPSDISLGTKKDFSARRRSLRPERIGAARETASSRLPHGTSAARMRSEKVNTKGE